MKSSMMFLAATSLVLSACSASAPSEDVGEAASALRHYTSHTGISLPDPNPVGGWSDIVVVENGDWDISAHFHDSGWPSYDMTYQWTVAVDGWAPFKVPDAPAYCGRVHGTDEAGDRDVNCNASGNLPIIRDSFDDIMAGKAHLSVYTRAQ
jgi:hypothetical protein